MIARLTALRQNKSFPDVERHPSRHALNCIRVLTRIIPFLYEAEHLETWRDRFFWQSPTSADSAEDDEKTEVLFEGANDGQSPPQKKPDQKRKKPLGEELIDTLIDLLFYVNFTLPRNEKAKNRVTYSIWESGVGCTVTTESSKELESNRVEVLRLLLTLSSEALYLSPSRIGRIFHDSGADVKQIYFRYKGLKRSPTWSLVLTSKWCSPCYAPSSTP